MTKKELSAYAGKRSWNLSQRMGGRFTTIYCLTVYEITDHGTCKYITEVLGCIANKRQYDLLENITGGKYHIGRPCAENLTPEELERICE